MKVKAQSKWVRIGPRKARRIMDLVRGKHTVAALAMLKFMPQKGARVIEKAIRSAVANAKNNFKMDETSLYISEAFVDESTMFRRFRCGSRGRPSPRVKRNSHVTVFVSGKEGKQ